MNKKYTFDDVKQCFKERGYILLSSEDEYHNSSSKLDYICPRHKDKGVQQIDYGHLKSGRGCYYCGRERTENAHKKPLDYKGDKLLAESRGFIYITSRREDGIQYIDFVCKNHTELGVQSMRKSNMKRNIKGCKYCHGHNFPEWYIMQKKDEVNPNIQLCEPYHNMTTRMKCLCVKHNCECNKTMQEILAGQGCYYCGLEKLSEQRFNSIDEVNDIVHKKNPHITVLDYKGVKIPCKCYCNKHKKEFTKIYQNLISGNSGCEDCYKEYIRQRDGLGEDEFKRRLCEIHPTLKVVGNYVNNSTPIEFFCTKHNHSFYSTPVSILNRKTCCDKANVNYKEEVMCSLLESWGYKITRQKVFDDCRDKRPLPFDCFLDDFNIIIEYDGEGHYFPITWGNGQSHESASEKYDYTKRHDDIKNNYCASHGISIIRVPYYKFDDLENYLYNELSKYNAIISN